MGKKSCPAVFSEEFRPLKVTILKLCKKRWKLCIWKSNGVQHMLVRTTWRVATGSSRLGKKPYLNRVIGAIEAEGDVSSPSLLVIFCFLSLGLLQNEEYFLLYSRRKSKKAAALEDPDKIYQSAGSQERASTTRQKHYSTEWQSILSQLITDSNQGIHFRESWHGAR